MAKLINLCELIKVSNRELDFLLKIYAKFGNETFQLKPKDLEQVLDGFKSYERIRRYLLSLEKLGIIRIDGKGSKWQAYTILINLDAYID